MKLSKEELKAKISEKVTDPELSIELLEDVEDSFVEGEVDNTELEDLKEKYSNLQERYKNRFLGIPEESGESEEKKDVPELETKDVIDIKEI